MTTTMLPPMVASPPALPASLASAGTAPLGPGRAREVAEAFESFFLAQVLGQMSSGLETDGPFGGGASEKTWRAMLFDTYAQSVTARGGIGIADVVQAEILRLQEVPR